MQTSVYKGRLTAIARSASAYYRRIPRIRPWAYLFHKDISLGLYAGMSLYADTKNVLLKSIKEVRSTLLKTTVQTKTTDDCIEMTCYVQLFMV